MAQDVLRAWGAPQLVHRLQWCQKGAVAIALRVVPSFVEFGPGVLLLWRIGIQGPLPVLGIDPTLVAELPRPQVCGHTFGSRDPG